jgi:carbon monoxide dehydrogenase subunit G
MAELEDTTTIDATADEVWAVAGDPVRLVDWLPGIGECSMDGDVRVCTVPSRNVVIRERIVEHSDDERYYDYELVEGSMPLASYRSRFSVATGEGDGAVVRWSATFEPLEGHTADELGAAIAQTYRAGLGALKERVEQQA